MLTKDALDVFHSSLFLIILTNQRINNLSYSGAIFVFKIANILRTLIIFFALPQRHSS